jgi:Phage protein (N4 Gp49/phage Sf6 gene 66) family
MQENTTGPATPTNAEDLILSKGLTKPRITPKDIEDNIVSEHYGTASDFKGTSIHRGNLSTYKVRLPLLTFCVLVLKNGFTVTGESACASPENFDEEVGKMIARKNAVDKIWPLMGYELLPKLNS